MVSQQPTFRRPNGHDTGHTGIGPAEAQCPYCGQSISRKEFKEIQAKIADEERARVAEVERGLQAKFVREAAKLETKAKRNAEQQVKALKGTLDATINARVAAQREASEKKLTEAVAAERTKAYGERMKMDSQLADLQRQLQRRTANELGDEGEIDLWEILVAEFPQDQIARVPKGVPGADIVQRVFNNGVFTGRSIIYDCKNHMRWQNKFTTKLREDQITAGADHAVLVAAVFPADERQLMVKDGVVVAAPARIVAVAHILRRHVIQTHALRLSNQARDEKVERLYSYLTSDKAADLWEKISSATSDLGDLDRAELAAHQKVWNRRAEVIRVIQAAHDDLAGKIDSIISGEDEAESPR